jgi:hypothetical protein
MWRLSITCGDKIHILELSSQIQLARHRTAGKEGENQDPVAVCFNAAIQGALRRVLSVPAAAGRVSQQSDYHPLNIFLPRRAPVRR